MPPRSPQTAAGQALMEKAEAIRDRAQEAALAKRRLVGVYGQLMVVLQPTLEGRDAQGRSYTVDRPVKLKFNDYMCDQTTDGRPLTDPEVKALIEAHQAFVGGPAQPKLMAWEGDPLIATHRQMPIQVIQGAIGAGPRPIQPPLANWNSLEPDAIRTAINEGRVNTQQAMAWEVQNRKRPAVLLDLAEAIGRGEAGPPAEEAPQVTAIPATPETFSAPMGG